MANMSYCRFQNTVMALRDCKGALDEALEEGGELPKKDTEEHWAMVHLLEVCQEIVDSHDPEDYRKKT